MSHQGHAIDRCGIPEQLQVQVPHSSVKEHVRNSDLTSRGATHTRVRAARAEDNAMGAFNGHAKDPSNDDTSFKNACEIALNQNGHEQSFAREASTLPPTKACKLVILTPLRSVPHERFSPPSAFSNTAFSFVVKPNAFSQPHCPFEDIMVQQLSRDRDKTRTRCSSLCQPQWLDHTTDG